MTKNKPISPAKRYVLRVLALAKKDPQIGALMPKETVWDAMAVEGLTQDRVIDTLLSGYADRPSLGERSYEVYKSETGEKTRKYLSAYNTITYQELQERIQAIAMAWRTHPDCQVHRDEFVCIMGFADRQFAEIDLACTYAKAVSVPMASSTAGADLGEIFANVEPVLVASTIEDLALSVELAIEQKTVKSVLVFNYDGEIDVDKQILENAIARLKEAGGTTRLILLKDLIAYGKQQTFSFLPAAEGENEKMCNIIHSSGSTGKPKGACISNKAMIHSWLGKRGRLPRVSVIMAPFNHGMGRGEMYSSLGAGGTAYFTLKRDMSTLFEDIRLARPTALVFFPRIFELIYQYFQNEVTRRVKSGGGERAVIEAEVMAEMKHTYLGDRLLFGLVGSAPTAPKVRKFIEDCFAIFLIEGYSNTETGSGALAVEGKVNRTIVLDYKLVDVPELGYFSTDKPYPRGEFCVKTKFGVKSYYKQPEATAGLLDDEGYNLTGDIVEERGPNQIVIIDRRKDVLKLSQGEYVAVGPLGKVFEGGSAVIHQIYVYGNSKRSYLLAVIVPEIEVVHKLIGANPTTKELKNLIRQELQKTGQKEALKSFEIPRDFIIEKEKFSRENELLSSVRKYLRPAIKRKYGPALEAMYEEHDRIQEEELAALRDPNSTLTTKEKLIKLLESNLGYKDFEQTEPRTFNELGGDSLGASLFSMSIENIFGLSLPANVILSPTGSIAEWAAFIEDAQNPEGKQATFANIHGKETTIIKANDLQLDKFLDSDLLHNASNLPSAPAVPKTVFLTGANGFLGHILCIDWMEKVATHDGKVICLIRAKDNKAAYERLAKEFKGLDQNFENKFLQLTDKHLEVLAGDISKSLFGLSPETYDRLTKTVDRICHPAALVNHRLAYPHLFGPNVVGTTEILRLAITSTKKPIDFVSTVGVQGLVDKSKMDNEDSPLLEEVKMTNHYANGYAISKWASEHLLQKASKALDLPINTFRCDMILADQRYKGQVNNTDMFTRLLYSIILTGLAPTSFYILNKDGSKASAHYDGTPVDVLTRAIIGVSETEHKGYKMYNLQNYHHDDTRSLDTFVDWIEAAGYSINRLDHKTWMERITDKLKALPEEQRQQSVLDLMMAYSRPYPPNLSMAGCANFQALVKQLFNGGDIPHLSKAFIDKNLADMRLLGMIE